MNGIKRKLARGEKPTVEEMRSYNLLMSRENKGLRNPAAFEGIRRVQVLCIKRLEAREAQEFAFRTSKAKMKRIKQKRGRRR